MTTISIRAEAFLTEGEAFQCADAQGRGRVVSCEGRFLVAEESELTKLEVAGVSLAYLEDIPLSDGSQRTVSIPVN